ncbi:MAG: phosphorylase [Candidatus Thiodiazotropha lotti]|nr:phosphorylase [Candidatus Thiodiazotropha lotti]MCG8001188.1 phosphorylase [Candidatus Thiodiazotropha lotti]MCW4182618.1 phosphorylase [Candidatus Thiodiazotropha weberae]MCW4192962.1 phosphorylase [Candidatus Thiodiazotropha weberae]
MSNELEKGTLWKKVVDTTQRAIDNKSLLTIETLSYNIRQQGLNFTVRVAENIKRKREHKRVEPDFNPFLPPEAALTVCDISPSHIAVLNKFNVVEHHLLIVTRQFESQQSLLTMADFSALCHCLPEYPSLGFYNAGEDAGASQKHKHLQMVPLPLYGETEPFPFSTVFSKQSETDTISQLTQLPFKHTFCCLPEGLFENPNLAANHCHHLYHKMLKQLEIARLTGSKEQHHSTPYNLLITRQWMLLVPRTTECWQKISVNAMAYVGSLFVMNQEGLKRLEEIGPVNLLQAVSQ